MVKLKKQNQSGISLVEVMIWMVVVGALMGAVMAGFGLLKGRADQSSGKSKQAPAPSTPVTDAPAVTFDDTLPVTIIAVCILSFMVYKFVLPVFLSRRSAIKEMKGASALRAAGWEALRSRKDALIVEWSKYETDVALMIDYPIMTDYTDPVVSKVIAAMQKIRTAEMLLADSTALNAEDSALGAAVDEFDLAFRTAEKYARRYGQTKLDPREQRKLSAARTALNIILDGDSPAYEVEAAYKSLRSSLKGIIDLPQRAVAALESKVRKELVQA